MPTPSCLSEDAECFLFADWLRAEGIPFSHLPLSTYTPSWTVKARNKRLGVSPGVPDYIIALPHMLLWIEMKKKKGGRVAPAQTEWLDRLSIYPVSQAFLAHGFSAAKEIVSRFRGTK